MFNLVNVKHIFCFIILVITIADYTISTHLKYRVLLDRARDYCSPQPLDDNIVQLNYRPLYCYFFLDTSRYYKIPPPMNKDCECTSECSSALTDPAKAECQPCSTSCKEIMQINVDSGSNGLKCKCVTGSDVVADDGMNNMESTTTTATTTTTASSDNSTVQPQSPANSTTECKCSLYCLPRTSKIVIPPCVYTIGFSKRLKSNNNKIQCECGIDRGEKLDTTTLNPFFKCICSKNNQSSQSNEL